MEGIRRQYSEEFKKDAARYIKKSFGHLHQKTVDSFAFDYLKNKKNIIFKIISTIVIIIGIAGLVNQSIAWRSGWGGFPNNENRHIWDEKRTIDYYEWEGMQWFKNNTKPDEIFFTDRRFLLLIDLTGLVRTFFGYSALSGRQAFIEGDNYLSGENIIIANDRWRLVYAFLGSKNIKLLREIQADYFIQSLRFNNQDYSEIDNLKLIYENKSIKIFKILE